MNTEPITEQTGFQKAQELVRECATGDGFLASPSQQENYRRIWSRDGVIIGLAAIMDGDTELIAAFGRTLETLAACQGPHGEIPSNVSIEDNDISYGGTAGRVDANLWFVIGAAEYWQATGNDRFIEEMIPVLEKVIFLLGAWEFNNRGFLYIPATGDWADEYIHSGYVLYDQLLYLQALKSYHFLRSRMLDNPEHSLLDKIRKLRSMIRANFWLSSSDYPPDHVYHEVLIKKGRDAADCCTQCYWLPFFSPHGYGYRFDTFANILASLLDVAWKERRETVDQYITRHVAPQEIRLLPAFYPVIEQDDKDWQKLKVSFSYDFKNRPYEFHNGGLWPMLSGFYAADLARRNKLSEARQYLIGIGMANKMKMNGNSWSFPEYVNGRNFTPGGTMRQCWSASAYLMAYHSIQGKPLFSINDHDLSL